MQLKKDLSIPETESYVSPLELVHNPKLGISFHWNSINSKNKKETHPYYQAVRRINAQLGLYNDIISGHALRLYPQVLGNDWVPLSDLQGEPRTVRLEKWPGRILPPHIAKSNSLNLKTAVADFKAMAQKAGPSVYPSDGRLEK